MTRFIRTVCLCACVLPLASGCASGPSEAEKAQTAQLATTTQERDALKTQLEKAKADLDTVHASLKAKTDEAAKSAADLDSAHKAIDDAGLKLKDANDVNATLKGQLSAGEDAQGKSKQALATAEKNLADAQAAAKTAAAANTDLQKQLDAIKAQNADLQKQVDDLGKKASVPAGGSSSTQPSVGTTSPASPTHMP